MKKIATLILAAGLVFGAATGASAIDFKAKGQWIMSFDYGQNGKFMGKNEGHKQPGWGNGQDDFEAKQRVRLQLDAVASESLSGTVYFEIGTQFWGKGSDGGALGADGKIVKLKNAYIDWMIPETDVKTRMGIQNITTPAYASGNSVLNDDVAGVVLTAPINEMVGVTAFWARPYNDNYKGEGDSYTLNANGVSTTVDGPINGSRAGFLDNLDLVGLLVPLNIEGAKVTPWGMYAGIGPNTFRTQSGTSYTADVNAGTLTAKSMPWNQGWNKTNFGEGYPYTNAGLFPVGGARHKDFGNANSQWKNGKRVGRNLSTYANAWWGGLSGDIATFDPFRIGFDFTYGSVTWEDDGRLNRQGWFATLLAEYKMDWGIPGIYGWYASGDDNNPSNGSERMPSLDGNNTNKYSNFAFDGSPYIAREAVIGNNMAGTWGIGGRLKDMSFIEDLKHTLSVNYIGGTNSPAMAKKLSLDGYWANSGLTGMDAMYLTTKDSALEFGLFNSYKMYENFTIALEADYIAMWLDTGKKVWGARHREGLSVPETKDAWNINASFVYAF